KSPYEKNWIKLARVLGVDPIDYLLPTTQLQHYSSLAEWIRELWATLSEQKRHFFKSLLDTSDQASLESVLIDVPVSSLAAFSSRTHKLLLMLLLAVSRMPG